jgi:hypothetical protein
VAGILSRAATGPASLVAPIDKLSLPLTIVLADGTASVTNARRETRASRSSWPSSP